MKAKKPAPKKDSMPMKGMPMMPMAAKKAAEKKGY